MKASKLVALLLKQIQESGDFIVIKEEVNMHDPHKSTRNRSIKGLKIVDSHHIIKSKSKCKCCDEYQINYSYFFNELPKDTKKVFLLE